jgi:hypothetical protein
MTTAMFAETLNNRQHSTRLIPENRTSGQEAINYVRDNDIDLKQVAEFVN